MRRFSFIVLMLLVSMGTAIAQTMNVYGVVKDETGMPAIGVSVVVEGTSGGTATDMDGVFQLNVPKGAWLKVTFVGYQSQRLMAKEKMEITLVPDTQVMDEVVVTGMTKMDKRLFTGASDQLAAEDILLGGGSGHKSLT